MEIPSNPATGAYILSSGAGNFVALPFNATAEQIQDGLEQLLNIGVGEAVVSEDVQATGHASFRDEKKRFKKCQNSPANIEAVGPVKKPGKMGRNVYVSEDKVLLSTDRSLQKMDEYKCDPKDWQDIQALLKNMDSKDIRSLKAPTDKRLYDGAAHATLTLKQGDVAYVTPGFDDGFPPEEIKELVNKVLSVGEKVKKQ